jgi:general secretion pathway protein I
VRPNASRCSAHRVSTGFTLLEVLVAMAIISLGLIGVFSSLGQMLSATSLLRDKTLATWIATDRITELRVNREYPDAGERKDSVDMAGVEWAYRIKVSAIPDLDMRRLDVSVSFADDPDNVIATVIGFLEPAQAPSQGQSGSPTGAAGGDNTNGRRFGEGWEPIPGENLNQDSE